MRKKCNNYRLLPFSIPICFQANRMLLRIFMAATASLPAPSIVMGIAAYGESGIVGQQGTRDRKATKMILFPQEMGNHTKLVWILYGYSTIIGIGVDSKLRIWRNPDGHEHGPEC